MSLSDQSETLLVNIGLRPKLKREYLDLNSSSNEQQYIKLCAAQASTFNAQMAYKLAVQIMVRVLINVDSRAAQNTH